MGGNTTFIFKERTIGTRLGALSVKIYGRHMVVNHNKLEQLILSKGEEIKVEYRLLYNGIPHAAVECRMTYGGQTVSAVGEIAERTLFTEMARNYPLTICYQRAFDRAAIRIMDPKVEEPFKTRFYSSIEISYDTLTKWGSEEEPKVETERITPEQDPSGKEEHDVSPDDVEPKEEKIKNVLELNPDLKEHLNMVFTIVPFKGKKLDDIVDLPLFLSGVRWIQENTPSYPDDRQTEIELLKKIILP